MWPLSLLALRQVTNNLQINRNHEDPTSIVSCGLNNIERNNDEKKVDTAQPDVPNEFNSLDSKFNKLFSKHIKKKKKYEIQEIAQVIYSFSFFLHGSHCTLMHCEYL